MSSDSHHKFGTRAIHAGQRPDPTTGAIMTPVYMTSTYVQEEPCVLKEGYDYSRTKNPTRTALEQNLAGLEGARHGMCFSSGMGAINCVLNLLESGDHVVAGNDLYGGTYRLCRTLYEKFGVTFSFVNLADVDAVRGAMTDKTRLLMMETPSNPLLRLCDIEALSAIAKEKRALSFVDNTFATPFIQNPLALGADIVVHSTTKYMGGHSDVVGGALCCNDDALHGQLAHFQNTVGSTPGPMDCFLVLRGTKTLHLRMERHSENAMAIAKLLEADRRVTKVHYPGLPSHPQYELAQRQMRAPGGMVSFELAADVEQAKRVASSFKLFALAESLGGVESLCDHPATMTHAAIPQAERIAAGFQDGLIRLSVGVEAIDDLVEDVQRGLDTLG